MIRSRELPATSSCWEGDSCGGVRVWGVRVWGGEGVGGGEGGGGRIVSQL